MVTWSQPAPSVRSAEVSGGDSHWALLIHCSFAALFSNLFLRERVASFEMRDLVFHLCDLVYKALRISINNIADRFLLFT